jgi:hypothetical protein
MSSASRHVYCCLLALMLIIVRTADAHAHLCADGREPPVSLHVGDGGNHPCETDPREDHSGDKDIQIASDVVLKKAPQIDPWVPTLLAFAFDVAAPAPDRSVRFHSTDDRFESIVYLRPPLRGPPA